MTKRALRTGSTSSSSRTLGLGLKGSKSMPNARRKSKQPTTELKLDKRKYCQPIFDEHLEKNEVVKQGLDTSVPYSVGTVITVECEKGYGLNLPRNITIRCIRGKWRPTRPKCLISPCQLPLIPHGEYLSGYRAGLTIANGSSVTYQCFKNSSAQPVYCLFGELKPQRPSCGDFELNGNMSQEIPYYLGGTDIVKGGDIDLDYGLFRKPCGPPARIQGSLVYRDGEPLEDTDGNFPDDTEITFSCIESIIGEKTTWRIICEDGSWIGRSLSCDGQELQFIHSSSNSSMCLFRNQEENVVTFYSDQEISDQIAEFPEGTTLTSRCSDIGKYAMTGSNIRKCINGMWDAEQATCTGLNQEHDYSMDQAPTILFRHEMGPIAQSNDGKLIVYPGVILHMECLWIRRFGVPKWTVSHDFREYPQSWTTDPGRDSQLEFRLSIYYASKEDSGTFTCVTPARYTHSVEIVVKAVHCPAIPQRRGLATSTQSTKMNTKVTFNCKNGNALIGSAEIVCLPSGNWSSPYPICESIECGEVDGLLPPNLKVNIVSRDVGGRAVFTCTAGFGLRGPQETKCLSTGEWALPFPNCTVVECETPGAPPNGYIQGTGPYKAGDVVQYNCNPDYMMDGQPIVACQDNGRWSGPIPKCIQACSYPGTTISGRMSAVKFYYRIDENITFSCDENYVLKGAAVLKCLKNGKWSNTIPTCVPANGDNQ